MNRLLLKIFITPIFSFFIFYTSFAQKVNIDSIIGVNLPEQSDTIILVDGVNKNDLYVRVKEWANTFFNSPKTVLQTDDKEGGILVYNLINDGIDFIVKSGLQSLLINQRLRQLASIYIKDNKVRIILSELSFTQYANDYSRFAGKGYKYPDFEFSAKKSKYELADGIDMSYGNFSHSYKVKLYEQCAKNAYYLMYSVKEVTFKSFANGINKSNSNFDF